MASSLLSLKINSVAPFHSGAAVRPSLACRASGGRANGQVSKTVVASAHVDPKKISQAAVAAFAAGCIAMSGTAYATESGIMPSRNRDEDNAARAMLNDKEAKNDAPAVQSRSMDKNSGNVDTFKVAGVAQADAREPKGKYPMKGPNEKASLEEQLEGLPSTRGNPNSEAAKQLDPKKALEAANDRSSPVSFSLSAPSLQSNVAFGTGEVGTMRDQAEATEKKFGAALSNPLEAAEQTAESTQRAANKTLVNPAGEEQSKEAAKKLSDANAKIPKALSKGFSDLKNQLTNSTAMRTFDAASLQHNVAFGTGEVGTMRDQAEATEKKFGAALSNPLEAAEQTAESTQRAANKTLVNPAGEEQSKEAAKNLSDANAEIPKALSKGFSDLKNQLTNPTAMRAFDASSLLHNANMQGNNFQTLQQNVRVGDLQSITGGQAKKAGPDEVTKADSKGGEDAQLITNESTSGVKARGASGDPNDRGAADRAAGRPDKLTNDKNLVP